MTLKWWQDPCLCASMDGFRCKTWKDLFKLKCKQDDEEPSFGLSLLCCPCSCISLWCFLPCIACKEYQVYHTIKDSQDVLIVKQPTSYHSIANDEIINRPINTTKKAPEQSYDSMNESYDSMNESLYYEKSNPIPIIVRKTRPRLTII
jgi:hypothetical protein